MSDEPPHYRNEAPTCESCKHYWYDNNEYPCVICRKYPNFEINQQADGVCSDHE